MMKIYIVQGSAGEYSERTEWLVCAYKNKEIAQIHAEEAQKEAATIETITDRYEDERDEAIKAAVWDKEMQFGYTGTRYFVSEIDVLERLPQ